MDDLVEVIAMGLCAKTAIQNGGSGHGHWWELGDEAKNIFREFAREHLWIDRRPHKVMTVEEYAAMPIIGWHEVCRDVDGFEGVGVRFLGLALSPAKSEATETKGPSA